MNKLYVVLIVTCLSACEPRAGVRVARDGDGYVVDVLNCSWDRAMVVRDMRLSKDATGQDSEVMCALTPHDGNALLERWRYGADVAGFQRVGCPPLERGTAYKIDVDTAPAGVTGRFTIDGNGDVKMIVGECS